VLPNDWVVWGFNRLKIINKNKYTLNPIPSVWYTLVLRRIRPCRMIVIVDVWHATEKSLVNCSDSCHLHWIKIIRRVIVWLLSLYQAIKKGSIIRICQDALQSSVSNKISRLEIVTSVFTIADISGCLIVGGRKLRIGKIGDCLQVHEMRVDVHTALNIKVTVFGNQTPSSFIDSYQRFGGTCLHCRRHNIDVYENLPISI
jgi:hypothetical protein